MTEIRDCPLCGTVEARVVAVDITRPDGSLSDEYRCTARGHLFLASQDRRLVPPGGSDGPGR